ncbi:MAG: hypothetical protein IPH13_02520 [Planctomycetes bacterium]|nr:hypothetical protein [Planctomycetota bacterium]MCC7170020.1 hypothetical protein [Planctomycetota bacterium]
MSIAMRRLFIASACALTASVGASLGLAQSQISANGQVIATTGDPVPGLTNGEVFGGSSTFDSGVIDEFGRVFFRGRFTGGTATTTTDRALFFGTSRADLQMILRSGAAEPSGQLPGVTINTASGTGVSGSNRINSNGEMMFGCAFSGGGVVTTNDSALYFGTPGNFQILAREGDFAPSTAGATYSSSFASPSQQPTGLNAAGDVLFRSSLTGGDVVGSTNNDAWFTGPAGNLTIAVRKGDAGPTGATVSALGFVSQLNSTGQFVTEVTYTVGTGSPATTAADDKAIWIYTPGFGVEEILREGAPSTISGVTHNSATNSWFVNTGACTFNASGNLIINSDLQGLGVTAGVNDRGVFLVGPGGAQTLVIRRGDAAPGVVNAAIDSVNNTSCQLNDSGFVAFQASMVGTSGTTDDSGIWAGTPGNLQLVLREGDVAPGTGGGTFGQTTGFSMLMNNKGQLLITNTVVGGAGNSCLFMWDPIVGVVPVIVFNDLLEVQTGVFKNMTTSGGIQFSNGNSRPLSFSDNGDYTVRVSTSDGASTIVRGHVGTFFGAPREISVATGGVHTMYVDGGLARAGMTYFVAGSATGTTPGLNVGAINIPLNPDAYFNLTLTLPNQGAFVNTLGTLDSAGRAEAALVIPGGFPILTGITLDHAWLGFDANNFFVFASESQRVTFVP